MGVWAFFVNRTGVAISLIAELLCLDSIALVLAAFALTLAARAVIVYRYEREGGARRSRRRAPELEPRAVVGRPPRDRVPRPSAHVARRCPRPADHTGARVRHVRCSLLVGMTIPLLVDRLQPRFRRGLLESVSITSPCGVGPASSHGGRRRRGQAGWADRQDDSGSTVRTASRGNDVIAIVASVTAFIFASDPTAMIREWLPAPRSECSASVQTPRPVRAGASSAIALPGRPGPR